MSNEFEVQNRNNLRGIIYSYLDLLPKPPPPPPSPGPGGPPEPQPPIITKN